MPDYDPEDWSEAGRYRYPEISGDYCECGQHYDEHDPELCEMRKESTR